MKGGGVSRGGGPTKEFYLELGIAEKKLVGEEFSELDVTKLIEKYTECIEYFDANHDPIAVYFEARIASTLTSPSVLKVLTYSNSSKESLKQQSNTPPRGRLRSEANDGLGNMDLIKLNQLTGIEKNNLLESDIRQRQQKDKEKERSVSSQAKDIASRLLLRKNRQNNQSSTVEHEDIKKENSSDNSQGILKTNPLLNGFRHLSSFLTSSNKDTLDTKQQLFS